MEPVSYLIVKILLFLLVATALGALAGWLLRGLACASRENRALHESHTLMDALHATEKERDRLANKLEWLETNNLNLNSRLFDAGDRVPTRPTAALATPNLLSPTPVPDVDPTASHYELSIVPSLSVAAEVLSQAGIMDTRELLADAATLSGRASLARQLQVDEATIRGWAASADLLRIPGVTPPSADLLVQTGVGSVEDLAKADATTLAIKLENLHLKQAPLGAPPPGADTLREWIAAADLLQPTIGLGAADPEGDDYPTTELQGVGTAFARRLSDIDIMTTQELLQRGQDSEQRDSLATALQLKPEVIERWVSMADFLRLRGVLGPAAELIACAGLKQVSELTELSIPELQRRIETACSELLHCQEIPPRATLERWVRQAQTLEPMCLFEHDVS